MELIFNTLLKFRPQEQPNLKQMILYTPKNNFNQDNFEVENPIDSIIQDIQEPVAKTIAKQFDN